MYWYHERKNKMHYDVVKSRVFFFMSVRYKYKLKKKYHCNWLRCLKRTTVVLGAGDAEFVRRWHLTRVRQLRWICLYTVVGQIPRDIFIYIFIVKENFFPVLLKIDCPINFFYCKFDQRHSCRIIRHIRWHKHYHSYGIQTHTYIIGIYNLSKLIN